MISLDFELHWGVRDKLSLAAHTRRYDAVYALVPRLLKMFSAAGIHCTWAAVGMLFFETKDDLLASCPGIRPEYTQASLSPYLDCDSVGENSRDDPYHFAPGLIRLIAQAPNQEIGTHTFSHYYCLEDGQTPAAFRADMECAIGAALRLGVVLTSIVFPRNQYSNAYLDVCQAFGISAYRGNPDTWFWRPGRGRDEGLLKRGVRFLDDFVPLRRTGAREHNASSEPNRIINVRATRFLRPVRRTITLLDSIRLRRIEGELKDAARRGSVYHLWWHPENFGDHPNQNIEYLGAILDRFSRLRSSDGMCSMTMAEFAESCRTAA